MGAKKVSSYCTRVLSFSCSTDTHEKKHCVLGLDYDRCNEKTVFSELKKLQGKYDLDTFYLFRNPQNMHLTACCFSIVKEATLAKIIMEASVDDMQKIAFNSFGCIGFRLTEKKQDDIPVPYMSLPNKSKKREQSFSLHHMFKLMYPSFIEKAKNLNKDNFSIIERYPIKVMILENIVPRRGVFDGRKDW